MALLLEDYTVSALAPDRDTNVQGRDRSLTNTPYTTLKTTLIKCTVGSKQQKLQQLLTDVEFGDQKPSQLLISSGVPAQVTLQELLCNDFLSMIRMVLASSDPTTALEELAERVTV